MSTSITQRPVTRDSIAPGDFLRHRGSGNIGWTYSDREGRLSPRDNPDMIDVVIITGRTMPNGHPEEVVTTWRVVDTEFHIPNRE